MERLQEVMAERDRMRAVLSRFESDRTYQLPSDAYQFYSRIQQANAEIARLQQQKKEERMPERTREVGHPAASRRQPSSI